MKYPCQGPMCHERPTKDRYNKKLKRLKGRNAYLPSDTSHSNPFKIFCTTGCQNEWIAANVENILAQRPITFKKERELSDQTYHITEGGWVQSDEYLTND